MIPLYGMQAVGGKIYSLDDVAVVKDSCALDGTGGTAFTPYLVANELRLAGMGAYSKLRRFLQKVAHDGNVTVRVTAIRDGGESHVVSRTLPIGGTTIASFPLNDAGSDLAVKLELTSYDAAVALSDSEFYAVLRRLFRV